MDTIGIPGIIIGILGIILGIPGIIIGILGLLYAFYTTQQFTKGIKIGALLQIRMLINRMEEEKDSLRVATPERATLHHTQQDLEALFATLKEMFKVSDNDAPR